MCADRALYRPCQAPPCGHPSQCTESLRALRLRHACRTQKRGDTHDTFPLSGWFYRSRTHFRTLKSRYTASRRQRSVHCTRSFSKSLWGARSSRDHLAQRSVRALRVRLIVVACDRHADSQKNFSSPFAPDQLEATRSLEPSRTPTCQEGHTREAGDRE